MAYSLNILFHLNDHMFRLFNLWTATNQGIIETSDLYSVLKVHHIKKVNFLFNTQKTLS